MSLNVKIITSMRLYSCDYSFGTNLWGGMMPEMKEREEKKERPRAKERGGTQNAQGQTR